MTINSHDCLLLVVALVLLLHGQLAKDVRKFAYPPPPLAPLTPVVPAAPYAPLAPVAPVAVVRQPVAALVNSPIVGMTGSCPNGKRGIKPCDAKRPWPTCPPDTYCYAVNSVNIGPYFCCEVWSTEGALWRQTEASYPHYQPMPYNWPYHIQATANWGAQVNPFAGSVAQFAPLLQLLQAKNAKQKQPLKIEDSAFVSGTVEDEDEELENKKKKR